MLNNITKMKKYRFYLFEIYLNVLKLKEYTILKLKFEI